MSALQPSKAFTLITDQAEASWPSQSLHPKSMQRKLRNAVPNEHMKSTFYLDMSFSRWQIFSNSFSSSLSFPISFSFGNQRSRFLPIVPSCLYTSRLTQTQGHHQATGLWMEQFHSQSSVCNSSLQFGLAGSGCLFPGNDHLSHLRDPLSFRASPKLTGLPL